jgi:Holliday junction resolvase
VSNLDFLIAENLTVAKLGERGFVATTLAGNAPNIDILACKNGRAIPVQVKAAKTGSVSLKADRFLKIELKGKDRSLTAEER